MKNLILRKRLMILGVTLCILSFWIGLGAIGGFFYKSFNFLSQDSIMFLCLLIFSTSMFFIGRGSIEHKPFYMVEDIKKGKTFLIREQLKIEEDDDGFISGYFFISEENNLDTYFIVHIYKREIYTYLNLLNAHIEKPKVDDRFIKLGGQLHRLS